MVEFGNALILNASFEPLCIVSARRALLLFLNAKAEIIHHGEGYFHAEKVAFPVPSVIRLLHYVKVSYHAGASLNRRAVFLRDGGKCQYCFGSAESIDHVVPKSRGGSHSWDNVVAACRSCNSKKRDRLPEEIGFKLRHKPAQPRQRISLLIPGVKNPEWSQYLRIESSYEVNNVGSISA